MKYLDYDNDATKKKKLRVKKAISCKLRRQKDTGQYSITVPQHLALAKCWESGDHINFYTNERGNMELIRDEEDS